jgi:hypothetical protein
MQPADGVVIDAVDTRRHHWRGALIGVGVVIAAGVLLALAPQPAHADDGDPGLVGSLVHGVATTVTDVVEPVAASLPDARELPVVGGLVGQTADSRPVGTATAPVAQLVDGLLGDAVGSLPVVGGLLGDAPGASITDPVGGVADGVLGAVAGAAHDADAVPADADTASGAASSALWLGVAAGGVAVPLIHRADDLAVMVAAGVEGLLHGPVSAPGDITPTSAVTAGGPPIGLAAAVLGAGLLFLLARGRVRPAGFRAPPSPVFATDTSPD